MFVDHGRRTNNVSADRGSVAEIPASRCAVPSVFAQFALKVLDGAARPPASRRRRQLPVRSPPQTCRLILRLDALRIETITTQPTTSIPSITLYAVAYPVLQLQVRQCAHSKLQRNRTQEACHPSPASRAKSPRESRYAYRPPGLAAQRCVILRRYLPSAIYHTCSEAALSGSFCFLARVPSDDHGIHGQMG